MGRGEELPSESTMTFEDSIQSGPGALSRASATCCMLSARKCAGLKSSRREARGIALTGFVDVDGVNSRTQICNLSYASLLLAV